MTTVIVISLVRREKERASSEIFAVTSPLFCALLKFRRPTKLKLQACRMNVIGSPHLAKWGRKNVIGRKILLSGINFFRRTPIISLYSP